MISKKQTDRDWEWYGSRNPYYGVIAFDKFRGEDIPLKEKTEFFEQGKKYCAELIRTVEFFLKGNFSPSNGLDFGCGVGRTTLGLSDYCANITGVDISESMLKTAAKNFSELSELPVRFILTDSFLEDEARYDFVHSFIVFQHIPVRDGYTLFNHILTKLEHGGVGALHFTFRNYSASRKSRFLMFLYHYIPFVYASRKLFGKPPVMQMNAYEIPKLLSVLASHDCSPLCILPTHHGCPGGILLFRKTS